MEGDYTKSSNIFINDGGYTECCYLPAVYADDKQTVVIPNIISRSQLLESKSQYSYPFADKLIQYLFSNVINPSDEIVNNIKKTQLALKANGYLKYIKYYGTWTAEETAACLLCSHSNLNHRELTGDYDVIGYLDSDIETELGGLD